MKKMFLLLLYINIAFSSTSQTLKTYFNIKEESKIGLTLNCTRHAKITMLDGNLVSEKEIKLTPGTHEAEIYVIMSHKTSTMLVDCYKEATINNSIKCFIEFSVEAGKTYEPVFFIANLYDSTRKTTYYNYKFPQIIEKETRHVVSTIKNGKIFSPRKDIDGKVHLYFDSNMPYDNQFALLKVLIDPISGFLGSPKQSFKLEGWTRENHCISYENLTPDEFKPSFSFKDTMTFYIMPGCYNVEFYVQSKSGEIGISKYFFRAKSGDVRFIDGKFSLDDFENHNLFALSTNLNDIFFLPDWQHGWIVGDNVICNTIDGGQTWHFSKQKYCNSISFYDSLNGWLATKSTINFTKDGGESWAEKNIDLKGCGSITNIKFFNNKLGFISTDVSLHITRDGGETWEKKFYFDGNGLFVFNADNIWKNSVKSIYRSTDMGTNWTFSLRRESFMNTVPLIYSIDPMHVWVLDDLIQYTDDGGKTWTKFTLEPTITLPNQIFFIDYNKGWIISKQDIYRTFDGGKHWERLQTKDIFRGELTNILFKDENNGWIIGKDGFIYSTSDGGKNWNVQNVLEFQ